MSKLELALAWPLLAAVLVGALPRSEPRLARALALIGALIELALLTSLVLGFAADGPAVQFESSRVWLPSYAVAWSFGLDAIALPFMLVLALVPPLVLLMDDTAPAERGHPGESLRAALVFGLQSAWLAVVLARDLISFALAWELAIVLLIVGLSFGSGAGDAGVALRKAAARRFAGLALLGAACLFAAVVLLGVAHAHATGGVWSWKLDALAQLSLPASTQLLGFVLTLVTVATCSPLIGLHGPLVATCVSGPTGFVALLLGIGMPIGLLALLRLALPMFPLLTGEWADPIAAIAVVGAIYAALVAWGEREAGRALAHLALVHMSLAIVAVVSLSADAWVALGPYLLAHALGLAVLTNVSHALRRDGVSELGDLAGWASVAPWAVTMATLAILVVLGIPGSAGFVGVLGMLVGVLEQGSPSLLRPVVWGSLAALCLGLATLGVLRSVWHAARGRARPGLAERVHELGVGERVGAVAAMLLALIFGVIPSGLLVRVRPGVDAQIEQLQRARCLAIEAGELARPRTHAKLEEDLGGVCLDSRARIRQHYGLDADAHEHDEHDQEQEAPQP